MDDRDQAVAVRIAVVLESGVVQAQGIEGFGREPGVVGGTLRHQLPRQREQRCLDMRGSPVSAYRVGGIERSSTPPGPVMPEGGMGDESVEPSGSHQRAELLTSSLRSKVAPRDR